MDGIYSYFTILLASSQFQAPKEEADDACKKQNNATQWNYRDSPMDESGRKLNWNLTNEETLIKSGFLTLIVFFIPKVLNGPNWKT